MYKSKRYLISTLAICKVGSDDKCYVLGAVIDNQAYSVELKDIILLIGGMPTMIELKN